MARMPSVFPFCFIFLVLFFTNLDSAYGGKKYFPKQSQSWKLDWEEFEEFREWKRYKNLLEKKGTFLKNDGEESYGIVEDNRREEENIWKKHDDTPPFDQPILMARYVVNQANWSSVATISTRKDIPHFPFVNVISVSDGLRGNGSGIPYMYLTPLDFTAQDVAKDQRSTLMMTLAQGPWCKEKLMDPMDPRCARITLSGKIQKISPRDRDYEIGKSAVFGRHPWLAHMPPDHGFFLAKLKISSIALLDAFGGPKYINIKDYLNASVKDFSPEKNTFLDYNSISNQASPLAELI